MAGYCSGLLLMAMTNQIAIVVRLSIEDASVSGYVCWHNDAENEPPRNTKVHVHVVLQYRLIKWEGLRCIGTFFFGKVTALGVLCCFALLFV